MLANIYGDSRPSLHLTNEDTGSGEVNQESQDQVPGLLNSSSISPQSTTYLSSSNTIYRGIYRPE